MSPVRVMIVEDHTLVRMGLRALLDQLTGMEVVAEAHDGGTALELLETAHPDVILMDITMPGLNGLETTARLGETHPHIRVLMLSMHSNEEYVWRALKAGATGYLLKDAGISELELAITAAMRGERYLSPAVSTQLVDTYMTQIHGGAPPREHLTPRQREILRLIAQGLTTKGIAQHLNLSAKTVETHRTQLMEQLGLHDIASLVRYAVRIGLVSVDE